MVDGTDWAVMKTELIHFILAELKPENKSNFLLWRRELGTKDFKQVSRRNIKRLENLIWVKRNFYKEKETQLLDS